jgi:glycosyltransferase involved in cell wall biosynthesis
MTLHIFEKLMQKSKTCIVILIFFVSLFSASLVFASIAPEKRPERQQMRTSVAIPCCGKHFQHLFSLLQYYVDQTQLPDEVVISLSDVERIHQEEIDTLEHFSWPFALKIIKKAGRESAGQNRNIAAENCTSEVILFQDADDVPHPQRVEVVKFVFENYYIDHLMHLWVPPQCHFPHYAPEEVVLVHTPSYDGIRDTELMLGGCRATLHNGNICLTREIAKHNKWDSVFGYDRDVQYNMSIYEQPATRTFVICAPLLIYRNELSSFL